jgi:D-aminopeptidase
MHFTVYCKDNAPAPDLSRLAHCLAGEGDWDILCVAGDPAAPAAAMGAGRQGDGDFALTLVALSPKEEPGAILSELFDHLAEALSSGNRQGKLFLTESRILPAFAPTIRPLFSHAGAGILSRPLFWNDITDVPGVLVGQVTKEEGAHHTGVTVILPCSGNIYERKPVGASFVLNGFGKTMGTIQLEELGTLETPIALTNTLCVGRAADGLVTYTLREGEKRGARITTVNPVVGETNDGTISAIEDRVIAPEDVLAAIDRAGKHPQLGCVGAGTGTICFGLKGGIGSASRRIRIGQDTYTLGALVQTNFGRLPDLVIRGVPVGKKILERQKGEAPLSPEKGSVMVVLGTDLPLTARQLRRVLKRAGAALARLGSYYGQGSGDVFLGFSSGNCHPDGNGPALQTLSCLPENEMDLVFRPAVEAVEEAILRSLLFAGWRTARDGTVIHALFEYADLLPDGILTLF